MARSDASWWRAPPCDRRDRRLSAAGAIAPRLDAFRWRGGRESMLRFGPDTGPAVIAALPLFEEANRTRAAMVDVLRRLAARGIGGALPDLPGTGESAVATEAARLADWRAAFAAAATGLSGSAPVFSITWRGGALVDRDAPVAGRWWLSPVTGAETVRGLQRVRAASGGGLYAGNCVSDALLAEFLADGDVAGYGGGRSLSPPSTSCAGPPPRAGEDLGAPPVRPEPVEGRACHGAVPVRISRLESDPRAADVRISGRPLWRAAEPGTDDVMQAGIAEDIASWMAACAD